MSVSSATSSSTAGSSEPSPMSTKKRVRRGHRKTVSFSDIDVIVLPWTLVGGYPLELACEPLDRYAVSVDSMEETRSFLGRFGDGTMSPVDRYNRIRSLSDQDSIPSLPVAIQVQEPRKLVEEEQHDLGRYLNRRFIVIGWALLLIGSCVMLSSASFQVYRPGYSLHQALKKMNGMIQSTEAIDMSTKEVPEKKQWMALLTKPKI
ncbi:unnamed protein product [Cylindrotheca closterium]|uniref:Uncharacterized protein n=1 Tax=Cylindrotheca closterium TaxID=2856 RepID=A0AAD2CKD1_9STRA|nr:unnamed protein product [Cylindrotheca closterium]